MGMEKQLVLNFLREKLLNQFDICRKEMALAQESANSEEKSSAGDKYETGRAMGQQQRDFYAKRLEEAALQIALFDVFTNLAPSGRVQAGCLIEAGDHLFFLGSGLGLVNLPTGRKVICTTVDSPLGKSLAGKKAGDEFLFAGSIIRIESLE
jgi:hypothetical protein